VGRITTMADNSGSFSRSAAVTVGGGQGFTPVSFTTHR
jgi:hypothetical protein